MTKLIITQEVWDKVMHWVGMATPDEVSGFGTIEVEEGVAYVRNVYLVEQENSGAETEMDATALGKLMTTHLREQRSGQLKWWWHSHANMRVFWSGTDHEAMRQLSEHGWVFATVFNAKGETRTAFRQNLPVPIFADELDLVVLNEIDEDKIAAWEAEYDENVKTKPRWPGAARWAAKWRRGDDDDFDVDEELDDWIEAATSPCESAFAEEFRQTQLALLGEDND